MARKTKAFPKQLMVYRIEDRDTTYFGTAETADEIDEDVDVVGIYELQTTATVIRHIDVKMKGKGR